MKKALLGLLVVLTVGSCSEKKDHGTKAPTRVKTEVVGGMAASGQQQYEVAKKNLADCRLTAPVSGIIGKKLVGAGTSKMSDLLEAQLLYQQSLDRRTDAYADYQNKLLEYRQATGQ